MYSWIRSSPVSRAKFPLSLNVGDRYNKISGRPNRSTQNAFPLLTVMPCTCSHENKNTHIKIGKDFNLKTYMYFIWK